MTNVYYCIEKGLKLKTDLTLFTSIELGIGWRQKVCKIVTDAFKVDIRDMLAQIINTSDNMVIFLSSPAYKIIIVYLL